MKLKNSELLISKKSLGNIKSLFITFKNIGSILFIIFQNF